MTSISKFNYAHIREKLTVKKPWDSVIILIITILISIPIFLILHQNLIDLEWPYQLDRILLAILLVVVIQIILSLLRKITLVIAFLYLLILGISSIFGDVNFYSVFQSYQTMLYTMNYNPYPQDIILSKLLPFPNKSKVLRAIEFTNPNVRNFALSATRNYFTDQKGYADYKTIIQCFAVFKEINSKWNYVNDPKNQEYIATASESLKTLSGDCDDHSILMAACVRAIGGTPRLIHTNAHIYPEILIGDRSDLEKINYLIKKDLFPRESKNKTLNYHIDERGQVWLNLDYTAHYPGGPFLSEEILGSLTLN